MTKEWEHQLAHGGVHAGTHLLNAAGGIGGLVALVGGWPVVLSIGGAAVVAGLIIEAVTDDDDVKK